LNVGGGELGTEEGGIVKVLDARVDPVEGVIVKRIDYPAILGIVSCCYAYAYHGGKVVIRRRRRSAAGIAFFTGIQKK
jgi:hypothetical protein